MLPDGCQGDRLLLGNLMNFSIPVYSFKIVFSGVYGSNFIFNVLLLIFFLVLGILKIWPG